jgi:hypothetical protein
MARLTGWYTIKRRLRISSQPLRPDAELRMVKAARKCVTVR